MHLIFRPPQARPPRLLPSVLRPPNPAASERAAAITSALSRPPEKQKGRRNQSSALTDFELQTMNYKKEQVTNGEKDAEAHARVQNSGLGPRKILGRPPPPETQIFHRQAVFRF